MSLLPQPKYIAGTGSGSAKLMIVGEFPTDDHEEPFRGPDGQILFDALKSAGLSRSEVYVTHAIKYRPPDNQFLRFGEIGVDTHASVEELKNEILAIGPTCILTVGAKALEAVVGKQGKDVGKWRGSILSSVPIGGKLFKVVPTIHPAHILRGRGEGGLPYQALAYFKLDVARAVEESSRSDLRPPARTLEIAKNSLDVHRFLNRYTSRRRFAADIEINRACIPTCISLAYSRSHAISIPLLHKSHYGKYNIPVHDLAEIYRLLDKVISDPQAEIIWQNGKFDEKKLRTVCGFRPPLHPYADVMLMHHTLYPEFPNNLAYICSVFTREPFYKDEGRKFDIKKDDISQYFYYNAKDSAVTIESEEEMEKELDERGLREFYFGYVNKLHRLYYDIEETGFRIDYVRRQMLFEKYWQLEKETQDRIFTLVGHEVNWASNHKKSVLRKTLFEELGLPVRESTDENTLVALLGNHAKTDVQKEFIKCILNGRGYSKTRGTYIQAMPDYDGRMRTSYKIVGTETSRTSTNIVDFPLRPDKTGLAFQTVTKHGKNADIQTMFIADEGFCFMEADLSQAEAREVAILADDQEMLADFDRLDIHSKTASRFFNKEAAFLKSVEEGKKGKGAVTEEERFVGKKGRHGGNYGMGKHLLMMEINSDAEKFGIDVEISEWKAGQILDRFHSDNPKIRGVFHALVRAAIDRDRTLINPFGRPREFYGRDEEALYREAYAYIPQSTVADKLKKSMLEFKKHFPEIRIAREWHDAFLTLVPIGREKEVGKAIIEIMTEPIDFGPCTISRGFLTIPSDLTVSYTNLKEMKKYVLD